MMMKACVVSALLWALPAYGQTTSVQCGIEKFMSRVSLAGTPTSFDYDGGLAAVVTYHNIRLYLELWDFTDPDSPAFVSSTQFSAPYFGGDGLGKISGTTFAGYSGFSDEITLVDISNSMSPSLHATIVMEDTLNMKVVGDKLYAVNSAEVRIYDISNLNAPILVGSLNGSYTSALDVVGDNMFVGNFSSEAQIYDISNPASISFIGSLSTSGNVGSIDIQGDMAAIKSSGAIVTMVDISDPANPVALGTEVNSDSIRKIVLQDGYVFTSNYSRSASIIDVSDPMNPISRGRIVGPEMIDYPDVLAINNQVWISGTNQMMQIDPDLSDVVDPQISASVPTGLSIDADLGYLAIHQGFLYAIDVFNGTLVVIEDSTGLQPEVVATLGLAGPVKPDIAFIGSYAYVLQSGGSEMVVIDITNPIAPTLVGTEEVPYPANKIEAGTEWIYAPAIDGVMTQFDVSDPLSPVRMVGGQPGGDDLSEFEVKDGIMTSYAYSVHGGGEQGYIGMADVSDQLNSVWLGGGFGSDVRDMEHVNGQLLYLQTSGEFPGISKALSFVYAPGQGMLEGDQSDQIKISFPYPDESSSGQGGSTLHEIIVVGDYAMVPSTVPSANLSTISIFGITDSSGPRYFGSVGIPDNIRGYVNSVTDGERLYMLSREPSTGIARRISVFDVSSSESECIADLTGDGNLNFFDVSAFLNAFSSQDPIADFTDDGQWNFFDVSAFLNAFAAGCP